mmetsp:Transcript_63316/g.137765  ORF Transcript_63316/g.137765 Transcript_63316/m.137765 type:complete len:769 (+) Transcript_63316:108-2414(+)
MRFFQQQESPEDSDSPSRKTSAFRLATRRLSELMSSQPVGRKNSLSAWEQFPTVSWRKEAQKDFDEHTSKVFRKDKKRVKAVLWINSWMIPALIGLLTATTGTAIEKAVAKISDFRVGYCSTSWFSDRRVCPDGGWVGWVSTYDPETQEWGPYFQGYICFIVICTVLATVSATLTWAVAPMARGSGIPEIKTILGGFGMKEVLDFRTLVVKVIGLSLSVGSGLACGKEGPLVHIACCWAAFLSRFFSRYAHNEAKQRELLSAAAAAGVSVAFGAPLGGVLFSLEEVSTMFPNSTMIRAFFAAIVAALTLQQFDATETGKLTMFETHYEYPPEISEYFFFMLLGAMGGCIGALFVHYNIIISKARAPGTPFRRRCHIILEVFVIALITAITSYPLRYTRVLSSVSIRALFHRCADNTVDKHTFMLDLCVPNPDGSDIWLPNVTMELVGHLLIAAALRFVQMIFTFGTGVPAGLFVPALYTGATLGRVVGILVRLLNDTVPFTQKVNPGIYAIVGAAAVLGGVCRVTISLVVIMFELTGGLQLIIPFMMAVLTSKWVGDIFTIGIYDYCIQIRHYPHLHEPDELSFHKCASDIMDSRIDCIHPCPGTITQFLRYIEERKHGGYPLTRSPTDATVMGYIHARPLISHLEKLMSGNAMMNGEIEVCFSKYIPKDTIPAGAMNISKFCEEAAVRVVPATPANTLHSIFRSLGVSLVLVTDYEGKLVGIITKKSFIHYMMELHEPEEYPMYMRREPTQTDLMAAPLLPHMESEE